jgi:hypothetical protein
VYNKSSPEQMLYNICSTFIKEFSGIKNELSSECTNKRFVDVCNSSYISISLCYVQLFADITLLQI